MKKEESMQSNATQKDCDGSSDVRDTHFEGSGENAQNSSSQSNGALRSSNVLHQVTNSFVAQEGALGKGADSSQQIMSATGAQNKPKKAAAGGGADAKKKWMRRI